MSRIAYCVIGLFPAGTVPAFDTVNGWFWLFVPQVVTIPDPSYPFIYNILDSVRLIWNINELTVDVDITQTPSGGGSPGTFTDTFTIPAVDNTSTGYSDEQELIINDNQVNFSGTGTSTTFTLIPQSMVLDLGNIYLLTTISFVFDGSLSFANVAGSVATSIIVESNIPSINAQTLYASAATASEYSGTLKINASQFWGYDGVFNTSTGAQLIIPAPGGL
jgi:hypothetical protein